MSMLFWRKPTVWWRIHRFRNKVMELKGLCCLLKGLTNRLGCRNRQTPAMNLRSKFMVGKNFLVL